MPKKYYTLIYYSDEEITCFSTEEIYFRLLCEKLSEEKAKAIISLVKTMEPLDSIIFEGCCTNSVIIRCWSYKND